MRLRSIVALASLPVLALTACSGGDSGESSSGGTETITIWTTQNQPERVAAIKKMTDKFTEKTGIKVKHSPVAEKDIPGLMVANAASGDLPDAVYFPVEYAAGWADQGLIDPKAADSMVEEFGRKTFSEGALKLATVDGKVAAVPTSAWGQLLVYRKDLFDAKKLQAPDTYDKVMAAAKELNNPSSKMYGITAATDPADSFTQQTFEHIALANGCQLTEGGKPALNSAACKGALEFYTKLMNQYSPGGTQTVETTRATYFAGQAAMLLWSPLVLDEMAGLRDEALPNCQQCKKNPTFLAENSGVVSSISGPSGGPAQYGSLRVWGVGGTTKKSDEVKKFLRYFYEDAYLDWLAMAPEGNIPMRSGTQDAPEKYIEGWRGLQIGVDRKAPLSQFYGPEIVKTLVDGTEHFDRWGLKEGQGKLVSGVYDSLMVPRALSDVLNGKDPSKAADDLNQQVSEELDRVGK